MRTTGFMSVTVKQEFYLMDGIMRQTISLIIEWLIEFCFVTGGTQFDLANDGFGTCVIHYQKEFITTGGCCDHDKVDR